MEEREVLGVVYSVCSCDSEKSAYYPSIAFHTKAEEKRMIRVM